MPPPPGVYVLVYERDFGWWQAQYHPNEEAAEYQPNAWNLIGYYGVQSDVTHWAPMPPSP